MPADRPAWSRADMIAWLNIRPEPEPRPWHADTFDVALRQVRMRNLMLFIQHPSSPHEED